MSWGGYFYNTKHHIQRYQTELDSFISCFNSQVVIHYEPLFDVNTWQTLLPSCYSAYENEALKQVRKLLELDSSNIKSTLLKNISNDFLMHSGRPGITEVLCKYIHLKNSPNLSKRFASTLVGIINSKKHTITDERIILKSVFNDIKDRLADTYASGQPHILLSSGQMYSGDLNKLRNDEKHRPALDGTPTTIRLSPMQIKDRRRKLRSESRHEKSDNEMLDYERSTSSSNAEFFFSLMLILGEDLKIIIPALYTRDFYTSFYSMVIKLGKSEKKMYMQTINGICQCLGPDNYFMRLSMRLTIMRANSATHTEHNVDEGSHSSSSPFWQSSSESSTALTTPKEEAADGLSSNH